MAKSGGSGDRPRSDSPQPIEKASELPAAATPAAGTSWTNRAAASHFFKPARSDTRDPDGTRGAVSLANPVQKRCFPSRIPSRGGTPQPHPAG